MTRTNEGKTVLHTLIRLLSSRLLYRVCLGLSVLMASNYIIQVPAIADLFNIANSASNLMMVMSDVGLDMVIMRRAALSGKNLMVVYGTSLVLQTITWIIILFVTMAGYFTINGVTTMFWILGILLVGNAFSQYRSVIRAAYRSSYHPEWITFVEVADGVSKVMLTWLIIHFVPDVQMGIYWLSIAYTITTILFVSIYAWSSFKIVRPTVQVSLWKGMIGEGIWFSMQNLIVAIYFEVDELALRYSQLAHWGNVQYGDISIYAAAANIVVFLLVLPRLALQIITPYLYQRVEQRPNSYQKIVLLSTRYLGALGLALGCGIMMLAPEILAWLYFKHPLYMQGTLALRLFGIFLIVRFIGSTFNQVFATHHVQKLRTKLEAGSVVLNIVLDFALIPYFSFLGCAIATLITEIVAQVTFFIIAQRLMKTSPWLTLRKLLPAVAAALGMSIVVYAIRHLLPVYLIPIPGAIIFALLLYAFKFFDDYDWNVLKPKILFKK